MVILLTTTEARWVLLSGLQLEFKVLPNAMSLSYDKAMSQVNLNESMCRISLHTRGVLVGTQLQEFISNICPHTGT